MKIISWNVLTQNENIEKGLDFIFEQNPDVICLQELPQNILEKLESSKQWNITSVIDFHHLKTNTNSYVAILSKVPVDNTGRFVYFGKKINSIYSNIVYKAWAKIVEMHEAIYVDINLGNTEYRIVNAHLSCSTNTRNKLSQLEKVLNLRNTPGHTIMCGDFNLIGNNLINKLIGWIREYSLEDYKIDEVNSVIKLFNKYGFTNIFKGKSTISNLNHKMFQLDYILADNKLSAKNTKIGNSF